MIQTCKAYLRFSSFCVVRVSKSCRSLTLNAMALVSPTGHRNPRLFPPPVLFSCDES